MNCSTAPRPALDVLASDILLNALCCALLLFASSIPNEPAEVHKRSEIVRIALTGLPGEPGVKLNFVTQFEGERYYPMPEQTMAVGRSVMVTRDDAKNTATIFVVGRIDKSDRLIIFLESHPQPQSKIQLNFRWTRSSGDSERSGSVTLSNRQLIKELPIRD